MGNLFTKVGASPNPDNLVAGNLFPVQTIAVTLAAGSYKRGDALVRDDDEYKLVAAVSDETDGSNDRFAVLLDDAEGETIAAAAITGEFNGLAMRFGAGVWSDYAPAFSAQGLFLKENAAAPLPPSV